jgi:outer membrane receptor for ferrienterochelin and colicins
MAFLLSGYCNRVTNKITSGNPYYASASDAMPRLPYVNIDKMNVAGFEATARARWSCGLDARLSYAFVDEQAGHENGQKLASPYLPARKHSLTAHADWTHRFSTLLDGMVALDGRFLSGIDNQEFKNYYKVEEGTITVHYPAYTLWKLSAQMGVGKHLKLTFAVDNLLNYRPKYYYLNSPIVDGTNVMVGCKVRL